MFLLIVGIYFDRFALGEHQNHSTCSHFLNIPYHIILEFLHHIDLYILECLRRSKKREDDFGYLYVREKHYNHSPTSLFLFGNFRMLGFQVLHNLILVLWLFFEVVLFLVYRNIYLKWEDLYIFRIF